jgi:hypothetical protein
MKSIPLHPISLRSILILFTHLRLGLSSGLLSSGFPTNILYAFLFSPLCYIPCPFHLPWPDHSNYTWRRVQVIKFLIKQFSPTSPVTSPLIGPNILLGTLFSNTLSLCSSLNVTGQVSLPYRTKGKIFTNHIVSETDSVSFFWEQTKERDITPSGPLAQLGSDVSRRSRVRDCSAKGPRQYGSDMTGL